MLSRTRAASGPAGLATVVALLAAAGPVLASGPRPAPPASDCRGFALVDEQPARADCCFTSPAYSGVCVVKPSKEETCASILAYLNNEQSTGKTYCRSTNIRGGWREVPCKDEPPSTENPGGR